MARWSNFEKQDYWKGYVQSVAWIYSQKIFEGSKDRYDEIFYTEAKILIYELELSAWTPEHQLSVRQWGLFSQAWERQLHVIYWIRNFRSGLVDRGWLIHVMYSTFNSISGESDMHNVVAQAYRVFRLFSSMLISHVHRYWISLEFTVSECLDWFLRVGIRDHNGF